MARVSALVVGASRGLGLALSRRLAPQALLLAAARRPSEDLLALQRQHTETVRLLELDVTEERSVAAAAAAAAEWLPAPGLQLLCHTAGVLRPGCVPETATPRQDKGRGIIVENQLQKVQPKAVADSFAVSLAKWATRVSCQGMP